MRRPLVCGLGLVILFAAAISTFSHAFGVPGSYCGPQLPVCRPAVVPLWPCCVPSPLFPPPPPLVVPIVVAPMPMWMPPMPPPPPMPYQVPFAKVNQTGVPEAP